MNTSYDASRRLDERVHDVVTILLIPFMLFGGSAAFTCALFEEHLITKLPYLQQAAYEQRVLWWATICALTGIIVLSGRISAYIYALEIYWELDPPPMIVCRRWGIVFCWSEHLNELCTMPFRWIRVPKLSEFCSRTIAYPQATMPIAEEMPASPGPAQILPARTSSWVSATTCIAAAVHDSVIAGIDRVCEYGAGFETRAIISYPGPPKAERWRSMPTSPPELRPRPKPEHGPEPPRLYAGSQLLPA